MRTRELALIGIVALAGACSTPAPSPAPSTAAASETAKTTDAALRAVVSRPMIEAPRLGVRVGRDPVILSAPDETLRWRVSKSSLQR